MNIRFLGHAAVSLETDINILIDPYISKNPLCSSKPEEFSPDVILLTHGHGDHLGDTIEIAKRTKCTVYAIAELSKWLAKNNIKTHGFNVGGNLKISSTEISVVNAIHSSSCPDGTYAGLACGFIIQHDKKTFYHAGDTALFSDMKLLGDKYDIDVAMLPIGGNYTMGIEDAVKAVKYLSPKICIPMHFNTFSLITCNPQNFKSQIETLGFGCNVLKPGSSIVI